jgi:hypothetical protein
LSMSDQQGAAPIGGALEDDVGDDDDDLQLFNKHM